MAPINLRVSLNSAQIIEVTLVIDKKVRHVKLVNYGVLVPHRSGEVANRNHFIRTEVEELATVLKRGDLAGRMPNPSEDGPYDPSRTLER